MGPSLTSVRAFIEQLALWNQAISERRLDVARFHAREVGVVGRLLAMDPGFKRRFAAHRDGTGTDDPEVALRSVATFLATVVDAATQVFPPEGTGTHPGFTLGSPPPAHVPGMETTLRSHIVWSGRDCEFPKAGVYYGLAPAHTHAMAAAWLLPRRGTVCVGGRTEVRSGEQRPLHYYAVRDPSAVRVVPVKGQVRDDPGHVSLIFRLGGLDAAGRVETGVLSPDEAAALTLIRESATHESEAGFVMTIGLRKDREREFFENVVLVPPIQPFSALCDRIQSAAADFGP